MALCSKRKFLMLSAYMIFSILFLSGYVYYMKVVRQNYFHKILLRLPKDRSPKDLEPTENNGSATDSTQVSSLNATPTLDPNTYLNINSYRYIINEPDKCKDQNPFFVFLIATIAKDVEQRRAIRNSWANEGNGAKYGVTVMHLFMLGFDSEANSNLILNESKMYHDIIQKDFKDTYRNLTFKTIMGMDWITTYCPQAKYAMKTDSDMFVNIEYLLDLLKPKSPPRQNFFTGSYFKDPTPHRFTESKWYVSYSEYPDPRYPNFCSGTGYVFSADLAPKILRSSFKINYLYLEDVFVGICLKKEGVQITVPPSGGLFNIYKVPFSPCGYYKLITSHGVPPKEITKFWKGLQEKKGSCSRTIHKL